MTTDALDGLRAFIASVVRDELKSTPAPANDEYLSTADAAKIARVTTGTIRRWVREKTLTKYGKGARVRIRRDELEEYLSGSTAAAGPEDRARMRFGMRG
jgi:excisionase family DNA binding protein